MKSVIYSDTGGRFHRRLDDAGSTRRTSSASGLER